MRKSSLFSFFIHLFFTSLLLWGRGGSEAEGSEKNKLDQQSSTELTAALVHTVRQNLMPLSEQDLSRSEKIFFEHYWPGEFHGNLKLGYFYSSEKRLAAYLFRPDGDRIKGTVFLLHGYLDHTLSNKYLIRALLENDYAVLGFDLPGHGLSEGAPAAVDDFREYSMALNQLIQYSKNLRSDLLPGPNIALGHSTGCSVLIEYFSLYGNPFDQIIMAAPLIHARGWRLTPLGISLAQPFTDSVFRRFGGSSSNKEHEYFVEYMDPLQSRRVPFSWVNAHGEWYERMKITKPDRELHIDIFQGKKDSVVDYQENIPFLLEKYPASTVYWFPKGEHSLFNEIQPIRRQVFDQIMEILKNNEDS